MDDPKKIVAKEQYLCITWFSESSLSYDNSWKKVIISEILSIYQNMHSEISFLFAYNKMLLEKVEMYTNIPWLLSTTFYLFCVNIKVRIPIRILSTFLKNSIVICFLPWILLEFLSKVSKYRCFLIIFFKLDIWRNK